MSTRREFLSSGAAALWRAPGPAAPLPWYRRVLRWGQTNITEADPPRYDIAWWREYWKRTAVQGVIINAGGIVAYYPSRQPLHRRAAFLGDRDLFGELSEAAHRDGLVVLARMDSSRASEAFYRAHPDWFAIDQQGRPYRAAELYLTCIHSPYYEEYIPEILREIIQRYHPEGFADNSWAGLGRDNICYCQNCQKRFRDHTGFALPAAANWSDPAYRAWIRWNYARRLEVWDLYNRVTRAAGGPDCAWIGMISGSISALCRTFRDCRGIARRAALILLDHQRRDDDAGFPQNAEVGKLLHGLAGWDKLIAESMAMYQAGRNSFRLSAKPAHEARLWMLEGFAGGIQPWWHHVGAYHEDRRAYHTASAVLRWHQAHQEYLVHRTPVADVGILWSQENFDFYGRDRPELLVEQPYRGWIHALVRARIPYLPVHADDIEEQGRQLKVLILPNLAVLSEAQAAALREFVRRGGSLVATGAAGLCDPDGERRSDFALADLFGVHAPDPAQDRHRQWALEHFHTYLRLTPERRAEIWGPHAAEEPPPGAPRHPVLRGFDQTDILPFGGMLAEHRVEPGVVVPLTFVPPFPVYPPETAWMRQPRTEIPALVLRELGPARLAFLPADIDRRYARDHLPDHGDLLATLVRWACRDSFSLEVSGAGWLDCHLYRQQDRIVLHLINLTNPAAWRAPVEELYPVGPLRIRIRPQQGCRARRGRWLVSGAAAPLGLRQGWIETELRRLLDHEVLVVD